MSLRKLFPRAPICLFCLLLLLGCRVVAADGGIPLGDARHLFDLDSGPDGPISLPTDIAVGKKGRIYVVDSGHHRILVYGANGDFLFSIGKRGRADGEFMGPVGIEADRSGLVYVADKDNHRIQVFEGDGKYKFQFAVPGEKGKLGRPIDIAASSVTGLIFVTENTQHRVLVFDTDGTLLGSWGNEGVGDRQFRYPGSILVRDGDVFVVDILNTVVKIFDERGQYQFRIGEWGVLPGQFYRPKGVAVDRKGRIYVTDSYMDVVEVFDKKYRFSHVLATDGKKRKFLAPTGITIDGGDRLYVAEMLGNKVSVFDLR